MELGVRGVQPTPTSTGTKESPVDPVACKTISECPVPENGGPNLCPGGCTLSDAQYTGTTNSACGVNGDRCKGCWGTDVCVNGACVPQTTPQCVTSTDCDDGDPCTADACDKTGKCHNTTSLPLGCEGTGWCNPGTLTKNCVIECCHGCLEMKGSIFVCVDACPSGSMCGDGLCKVL